ncbi:MAG: ABC transporter substrate-binding protein [Phycisphaerae bacterium]
MKRTVFFWVCLAMCLPGCSREKPLPHAPRPRVVSHSPALTHILLQMGLHEHVVGVTAYCPELPGEKRPVVGDLTGVNTEAILAADPDIVLIQQKPEDFTLLRRVQPGVTVAHFRLDRLEDIPEAAFRIADLLGKPDVGIKAMTAFGMDLVLVEGLVAHLPKPRMLAVMGTEHPSVHGAGSFMVDLIEKAGGTNAAKAIPGSKPWRNTTLEQIVNAKPEVLLVQVSDAEAARKYWMQWEDIPAVRNDRVHILTDDAWMRPTLKMPTLAKKLAKMIHPGSWSGETP